MSFATRAWLLGMLGVVVGSGNTGCWRANVYAITDEATIDGGSDDQSSQSVICPSPGRPAGDSNETLQVGTMTRTYVLHIPPAYDGRKPVPLILDFHGIGSSGASELSSSPYPAETDPEGVIMAFPDGMKGPIGTGWNVGPCCVAECRRRGLCQEPWWRQVQTTACIDPDRVYAVGVLTGGGMAYYLACQAADVFACRGARRVRSLGRKCGRCNPSRPITVISFRGTADTRRAVCRRRFLRGTRHADHLPRRQATFRTMGSNR
jgi:polyhydroxybutyrate depolymerase